MRSTMSRWPACCKIVAVGCLLLNAAVVTGIRSGEEALFGDATTDYPTEDGTENPTTEDEVTFSNATVLHMDDSDVSVITRALFAFHPQLEHFRIAGVVQSIEVDAFTSTQHLTTLLLDNNLLTAIPSAALRALPHLVTLSIDHNRLAELRTDDFLGASTLQWLSLSENSISYIPPGTFADGSPSLTFLNVSWNRLTSLDGIAPLQRLKVLDLGYNSVKQLNDSHLAPLKDLRELSVRANLLDSVSAGAFASLAELRRLDLGDNFLKSLPKRLFNQNRALEELRLDANILESVAEEQFWGLTQLHTLHLQNNRLVALPDAVFRHQPTFVRLSLEGNWFAEFDSNVLRSTDVLLQNNRIRVLKRTAAPNASLVEQLFLYGNGMASIEQDALANLPTLEGFYADYNRIAELPAMLYHACDRLHHVGFSRNVLTVLGTNTFAGLPRLHSVDLSHNRLSVIEADAFHGSPIEYLNLDSNRLTALDARAFRGTRLLYLSAAANEIPSLDHRDAIGEFQNLTQLTLADNRVGSLQPLCQHRFPKLELVELQNNSLVSIDASCGGSLPQLDSEAIAYNLSWNGLKAVPSLPGRVQSLDLSGNLLTALEGNQLRPYRHTETIILRNTSIASLSAACFAFLVDLKRVEVGSPVLGMIDEDTFHSRYLQHLEINDTPLTQLPDGLLAGQTNLSLASFARNQISTLPSEFFQHCTRLEDINLAHNALQVVDSGWFTELRYLRAVNIEGNRIAQLPADLFKPYHSLNTFSVAHNRLQSIDEATFLAEVPIKACNLAHNLLEEIGTLERNGFVTHLDVSGNRLKRLLVRSNFHALLANSNRISSLDWERGGTSGNLRQLWVANNLLDEIDTRVFEARQLSELDVSENRLHRFPFELVHRLRLLHTLNVSRNDIRSVPEVVPFNFKLATLDLSENPLDARGGFLNGSIIDRLMLSMT